MLRNRDPHTLARAWLIVGTNHTHVTTWSTATLAYASATARVVPTHATSAAISGTPYIVTMKMKICQQHMC